MPAGSNGGRDAGPLLIGGALGTLLGAAVGAAVWWIVSRIRRGAGSEPLRGSDPTPRS